MIMFSQATSNMQRRRSKWTIKVYHIRSGNANTMWSLSLNIEERSCTVRLKMMFVKSSRPCPRIKRSRSPQGRYALTTYISVLNFHQSIVCPTLWDTEGKKRAYGFWQAPWVQDTERQKNWVRGLYVEKIGNIDEATAKLYIQKQVDDSKKGND